MKKWRISGLIVFLMIGIILVSGCASTGPTGTTSHTSVPTTTPLVTPTLIQTITSIASLTTTSQPLAAISPQTTQGTPVGATLKITLGTYENEASVYADSVIVGNVSPGIPFTVRLSEGNHEIKVCKGTVCITQNVLTPFGKVTTIELGEKFNNAIKSSVPSATIVNAVSGGDVIIANVEFSNPTQDDLFMTATVQGIYSYRDENGSGNNPTIGTASGKVPAGGLAIFVAELPMRTKSNALSSAAPTIIDFKFSKVIKNT
ncbi:MAG: hypothetical protein Q7T80_05470 [Methanoregula sp.]|nr:hypothetical protein [Methanoregula sp.]